MATAAASPRPAHVLCLASGGLDSTVVMATLARRGHACTALFVDYGQRAVRAERAAVAHVTGFLRVELTRRRIRVWSEEPHGLVQERRGNPEPLRGSAASFLLHRNLLLLAQADIVAAATGIELLAIGVCATSDYPDCGRDFLALAESTLRISGRSRRTILAPLVDIEKPGIGALASELGLPIERTHSCHSGNAPCAECDGCQGRALALGSRR
jgi:7-cyano-7-deazaguanine synthase